MYILCRALLYMPGVNRRMNDNIPSFIPETQETQETYYTENNCNCPGDSLIPLVVQCRSCETTKSKNYNDANQKRIWKASRVSQSQYLDSISSLNVYERPTLQMGVNWNQMSDRAVASIVYRNVPSHGNSTKQSLTRHRPGSSSAPGIGVDVKHGSYHRYLERLKGKGPSRTQSKEEPIPLYGNKTKYYGISDCLCE